MLLLEASPETDAILSFIEENARSIQDSGAEPRFIVAGPLAYTRLREAVAERFGRENQHLEQMQWLTVVVDPSRGDRICVLPPVRDASEGVRLERV